QVKPTGWHTVKYDIVDGKYLYNRCHLIGYQLTGENANVCNLITGTRSMNVDGMLPFENMVADYVKETGNHVLYRVIPIFEGTELLARGVTIEAYSVEDDGEGICFNVYVYNVQPGIEINYATGESKLAATTENTTAKTSETTTQTTPPPPITTQATTEAATQTTTEAPPQTTEQTTTESQPEPPAADIKTYVLNTNSKKFHFPSCGSVTNMKEANKKVMEATRDEVIALGYSPCGNCHP
ncbi:MAG: DNA/RNA non-specific endonuclease, partial [Oscillospiraceae bacterium]|nr:DNA/RNA non-specific endonuclease [Oscillospiraceae bacterium]